MNRAVEGLKSEALLAALQAAVESRSARGRGGRPGGGPHDTAYEALAQLLAKHGGLPGLRPNLKLAAAFGAEVSQLQGSGVGGLLDALAADISAPDTPRAFLPVAAAHGYAQRVLAGAEVEEAWRGLQLLAADERAPVRMGAIDALSAVCAREGNVDALVQRAEQWLDEPERELCYGAVATVIEVLSQSRLIAAARDPQAVQALLSRVMDTMSAAPRAAYRSDGRKRVLRSLPNMLANVVAASRASQGSAEWFGQECERTRDPELREVLSQALQRMADLRNPPARGVIDELRAALSGSQKPLRDPTRLRPGTGRGKRSRPLR